MPSARIIFTAAAILIATIAAASFGSAYAEIVSIEAVRDNTLYESATGALSNGEGESIFAGRTLQGGGFDVRRALVSFDVAGAIPTGAVVHAATLRLFVSRQISSEQSFSLHRVLADWGEGSSLAPGEGGGGAPAAVGDATWLHTFRASAFWVTPGGDFTSAASATRLVDAVGPYEWTSSGLRDDVQDMLDQPEFDFGWLLAGVEDSTPTAKRFSSRESSPPENRPTLVIEYSPAAPVPGTTLLPFLMLVVVMTMVGTVKSLPGLSSRRPRDPEGPRGIPEAGDRSGTHTCPGGARGGKKRCAIR